MGRSSHWLVGRAVVFVLDVLSVVGCGRVSSDSDAHSSAPGVSGAGAAASAGPSASGGTAGAATSGATSGVSGSAGAPSGSAVPAALLLGDSPTEVCIAYTVAECLRRSECAGHPSTVQVCLSNTSGCP
ncbi:MAG TPA: hypothetical protein VGC79_02785, partial [Polyangiaceae bacterium]